MKIVPGIVRTWRRRRRDLAFQQLENPSSMEGDSQSVNGAVSAGRAEGNLFRRATHAKTRSEWRGD